MPYKNKEAQRKAVRDAVNKHRKGITEPGITPDIPEGITLIKPEGTDKITAAKLLIICQSLNKFDVAQEVRQGVNGPTMDIV